VKSCVEVPAGSGFGLQNLPYGVFSLRKGAQPADLRRRIGTRIGSHVLDLGGLAAAVGLPAADALSGTALDTFMAAGPSVWGEVRQSLVSLLQGEENETVIRPYLHDPPMVEMHLAFAVGDYVDFYSSEQHARNVGLILRPGSAPLTPNWKHLPIGYHGRSGTVVVSGTPIRRPFGLTMGPDDTEPVFGPSGRLDMEAEVGFVVGVGTGLGERVGLDGFEDHVFGACLLNDWSARDIQAFEYVPLGPFLGKSFATSVSPWLVPLEALKEARVAPPTRERQLATYLDDTDSPAWGLDIRLEIAWNRTVVSRPPFAGMYWTAAQQLAHMTVNGAALRTGDLYASGTVSGAAVPERGSILELTWNGRDPVRLADGSRRAFLADGDVVTICATAPGPDGSTIAFGEVTGQILPAR
jgi:fumarylacetoacetase